MISDWPLEENPKPVQGLIWLGSDRDAPGIYSKAINVLALLLGSQLPHGIITCIYLFPNGYVSNWNCSSSDSVKCEYFKINIVYWIISSDWIAIRFNFYSYPIKSYDIIQFINAFVELIARLKHLIFQNSFYLHTWIKISLLVFRQGQR